MTVPAHRDEPPVTPASVIAAIQAMHRDREQFTVVTGWSFTEDGRLVPPARDAKEPA